MSPNSKAKKARAKAAKAKAEAEAANQVAASSLEVTRPQAESLAYLNSIMGKTLRITVTDGRAFAGTCKSIDQNCNIILATCHEYRPPTAKELEAEMQRTGREKMQMPWQSRFIGMAVVPGKYITKIELEQKFMETRVSISIDDLLSSDTETLKGDLVDERPKTPRKPTPNGSASTGTEKGRQKSEDDDDHARRRNSSSPLLLNNEKPATATHTAGVARDRSSPDAEYQAETDWPAQPDEPLNTPLTPRQDTAVRAETAATTNSNVAVQDDLVQRDLVKTTFVQLDPERGFAFSGRSRRASEAAIFEDEGVKFSLRRSIEDLGDDFWRDYPLKRTLSANQLLIELVATNCKDEMGVSNRAIRLLEVHNPTAEPAVWTVVTNGKRRNRKNTRPQTHSKKSYR